ncbi:MAG TPA: hypothetical protein VFC38_06985 [Stellaceae bacterium]|nr:hypothetical protein [Stellaceae bacterium]
MDDTNLTIRIAADPSDLQAGLAEAAQAADQAFARIRAGGTQSATAIDDSWSNAGDGLTKTQQKVAASWMATFRPITQAFDRSVAGMILGTTTWQKAVQRIGQSIIAEELNAALKIATNWAATELAKTTATQAGATARGAADSASQTGFLAKVAQMLAQWLGLETTKTSATTAGDAARTASDTAAGAAGMAGMAARGFAQIQIDAAVAAAGAMAATAAIPFVGPELAPAAAAATYAETIGWAAGLGGGVFAAAGGMWEVPGTILSVLHPQESVIPAAIADPMRDFFSGGGKDSGAAPASGDSYSITIQAIDTQTGAQFLKNNMRAIAQGLAAEMRNFNPHLTTA